MREINELPDNLKNTINRDIQFAVVHCSASDKPEQDNIQAVKELHTSPKSKKMQWGKYPTTGKGWSDVGYHYFIKKNGIIQIGRDLDIPGAHVAGHNRHSIGICFSGEGNIPTEEQKESFAILKEELKKRFNLKDSDFYPHNHFDPRKTCPNFKLSEL